MYEDNDPGAGPLYGTQGNSKILVDATIDGAAVVLSGFFPPAAPWIAGGASALKGVGTKLQEHQEENIQLMLSIGQKEAGLLLDDFLHAVTSSPERLLPFVSACDAARRTALNEKVRALGRATANLAGDEALVDESAIWIHIFSQIEGPHVRMIQALTQTDPEQPGYARYWKRHELRERCGLTSTVSVLINSLTSMALMREIPYEELDEHSRARWSANRPGSGGSPLYGKGPLTMDFLEKLNFVDDESSGAKAL
ncbi:hypothetical protein [Arthrobacter citreus]|uniref:hypothetical protein n=1 Tax=Arthrobacter citreus TaxID=1670 RepID=UPI0036DC4BB5